MTWRARRATRRVHVEIPIAVTIEVPFLIEDEGYVGPDTWSGRIASGPDAPRLEEFSPWKAGPGNVGSSIIPDDFRPTARIAWSFRAGSGLAGSPAPGRFRCRTNRSTSSSTRSSAPTPS